MHRVLYVLLMGGLITSSALAQRPNSGRGNSTARSANARAANTTGFGVGINIPLSNNDPATNPSQKPMLIVATCNATSVIKNLEGWVGSNNPATVQDLVASNTGNHRTSITFLVPWGWYYHVKVSFNTIATDGAINNDETTGMAPNMTCKATAWWTD